MRAAIVRRRFPGLIIGVSTHNQAEVVECREAGADIALFGPVFDTPRKGPAAGLKALADVCSSVDPFPVLALGGVDQTNWRSVLEAGAAGFAAIRSFNDIGSLRRIMGELRN
jgi:thiamine-phosphate pyrophosphorylase